MSTFTLFDGLAHVMHARDHDTFYHARRTAAYFMRLTQEMGIHGTEIGQAVIAAQLHDIGKLAIPDAILLKKGKLTPNEWKLMKQHTLFGQALLQGEPEIAQGISIVRNHHERYDGQGYPDAMIGEAIPLVVRIFSVCDAYDAMTSIRPYCPRLTHQQATKEIQAGAGKQFDPQVVIAFLSIPANDWERIGLHNRWQARQHYA
jgi:HD-GYP domain-containing protein (c-di-GMP phosphodiesterase class II)